MNLLTQIETDPRFKELSYEEQAEVRTRVFSNMVKDSPEFHKFNDATKTAILERVAFRSPAFQDDILKLKLDDTVSRFKSGDKKATQDIMSILQAESAFSQAVLVNLIGEKLVGNLGKQLDPLDETKRLKHWHLMSEPDEKKALDYLNYTVSKAKRGKFIQGAIKAFGMVVNIAEIVGLSMLTAGTWAVPMGIGKSISLATKAGLAAARTSAKEGAIRLGYVLAHGSLEGALGVGRELAKDWMNGNLDKSTDKQLIRENSLRYFKDYFLWDVLVNAALAIGLPMAGSIAKQFNFKNPQVIKGMSSEDWYKSVDNILSGGRVEPDVYLNAPKEAQELLDTINAVMQIHKRVPNIDADDMITLVGAKYGYNIRKSSETAYTATFMGDTAYKKFNSFDDLRTWLTGKVRAVDGTPLTPKEEAMFTAGKKHLQARATIRGKLTDKSMKKADALTRLIAPEGGEFHPGQIREWTKQMAKASDAPLEVLEKIHVAETAENIIVRVKDFEPIVFPRKVASAVDELTPIRRFVDTLDEAMGTRKPTKIQTTIERDILDSADNVEITQTKSGTYKATFDDPLYPKKVKEVKEVEEFVDPDTVDLRKMVLENTEVEKFPGSRAVDTAIADYLEKSRRHRLAYDQSSNVKDLEMTPKKLAAIKGAETRAYRKMAKVWESIFGKSQEQTQRLLTRINELQEPISRAHGIRAKGRFAKPTKAVKEGVKRKTIYRKDLEKLHAAMVNQPRAKLRRVLEIIPETGERTFGTQFYKGYKAELLKQRTMSPVWSREIAKTHLNSPIVQTTTGGVGLKIGKRYITFTGYEELNNYLLRQTMEIDDLKNYLREYQGINVRYLKKSDEYVLEVTKGDTHLGYINRILDRAPSEAILIEQNPHLFSHMPADLGPKLVFTQKGLKEIQVVKGAVIGDYPTVTEFLSRFANYKPKGAQVRLRMGEKGYLKMDRGRKGVEVFVNETSDWKTFRSIKEGKKWLESGYQELNSIKEAALRKGYKFETEAGAYVFWTEEGKKIVAKTKASAYAQLAKRPTPEWAPELTGFAVRSADVYGIDAPEGVVWKLRDITSKIEGDQLPAGMLIQKAIRPKEAFISAAVNKAGQHEFFYRSFLDIEATVRLVDSINYDMQRMVNTAFLIDGKMMKTNRRKALVEYMRASDKDKAGVVQMYNLTQKELDIQNKMRHIFGNDQFTGLAKMYGVTPDDFILNYLPNIRKLHNAGQLENIPDGEIKALFENHKINPPHAPGELDAFFKHQRVSDLIDMSLLDDPLEMLGRYTQVGTRERLLGPIWDRVGKEYLELSKAGALKDPEMGKVFNEYAALLMGVKTPGEITIEKFSQRLFKQLGLTDVGVSRDVLTYFRSAMYFGSMGYRMWLPVRNSFQPYVTLAPRLGGDGNHWVSHAIRRVVKDKGGLFNQMRLKGVIRPEIPMVGAKGIDRTTLFGRMTNNGLRFYKNSDDFTRVVAYLATTDSFDSALAKLKKKIITQDEFLELSNLNQLDDMMLNRAMTHMNNKRYSAARDMLGKQMVDETMFVYRAGAQPSAFRGVVGKMFGMFGQYPTYYLENIRRGLSRGTLAQKITYAGLFVANTQLLYHGFKSLGVNAQNFLFWTPAIFTGGPMYKMMNEAMASLGRGYEGRQARAKIFGIKRDTNGRLSLDLSRAEIRKWFVPAGFATISAQKGIDALNEGDWWRAVLNFTTTPTSLDFFEGNAGGAETPSFVR